MPSAGRSLASPRFGFAALAASLLQAAHAAPPPSYALNLGVYRPSTNHVYAYADLGSKSFAMNGVYGVKGDLPVVGDFDGNGVADLAVFHSGTWLIDLNHDLVADQTISFGAAGDVPLAGDFDGDGKADLVVFRAGTWYIRYSTTGQTIQRTLGAAGDQPVVGDFDGDGLADIAVFRHGTWLIQTHSTSGPDIVDHFGGMPGDTACAVDWNQDGITDLCVYRNGLWYFQSVGAGVLLDSYALGSAGDIPLAGGAFSNTGAIFVNAGATGTPDGSAAHPYPTITEAFDAAVDGSIIRVAAGTYAENVALYGPAVQYAYLKYGKNNLKLLGASRRATKIAPATGDAVVLWGSSGNVISGLNIGAPAERGIVLIGGAGSVNTSIPGATAVITLDTIAETNSYGVLVTGASHADIRYNHINRSKTKTGIGTQGGAPTATIAHNEIAENGYTLAVGADGNGVEAMSSSVVTIDSNQIHDNNRFGIIGVTDSHLTVTNNAVDANRLDGLILCGSGANDTSTANVVQNSFIGNGTGVTTGYGYNGVEFYSTCLGTQTVTGNVLSGNTGNGIFIGSGKATISANVMSNNADGITIYADSNSSTNTSVSLFGNAIRDNLHTGVFVDLASGSSHTISALVGGTAAGQSNELSGQGYHAIGCALSAVQLTCPSGGNVFFANTDDIESTCPSSCSK